MSNATGEAVKMEYLAQLVRNKRKAVDFTLQEVADETGISIATLSRLEQHASTAKKNRPTVIPDTRTLAAVTQWLGIPLEQVLESESGERTPDADVDLPLFVETHLRASKRIKTEQAKLLGSAFRAMYERFAEEAAESPDEVSDSVQDG